MDHMYFINWIRFIHDLRLCNTNNIINIRFNTNEEKHVFAYFMTR